LPYIQFADNINEYLTKGLKVKYIRTSGSAGNVKAKALNKLVNQTIKLHKCENQVFTEEDCVADDTKLTIQNPNSSTNGFDMETIDQAYENFKHQVGTFDTLITCFDYANAIYNMINDTFKDNTPLVSNCQVSDKKDDINFTNTVIQYDRYGIKYENIGTQTAKTYKGKVSVNQDVQYLNEIELKDKNGISIRVPIDSIIHNQNISQLELNFDSQSESISAFDLYIYPLNPIRTSYTTTTYQNSFKPNFSTFNQINEQLEDYKCMAHTIHIVDEDSDPQNKDRYVYLIKNYYSLQAKISTTHKVTSFEVLQIRNNINEALFKQFNARKLEYGEEISYDELLKVIQEADPRIKYVILDEPTITTKFMTESGNEYDLKFTAINEADPTEIKEKKQKQNDVYQKLIAKNVLAGRAPLFKYNQDIEVDFNKEGSEQIYGTTFNYLTADDTSTIKDKSITAISSDLKLNLSKIDNSTGYTLRANESLQVVNNALVDLISYPMYINYYFKGNDNRFKNNVKFNRAAYLQEITSKTLKD
jgi:hypothetical protein